MIGGETKLPDHDQTKHHIRSQCSKLAFVNTKDYPFGGGNEDFEVYEESSKERASLMQTGQDHLLIGGQTLDIVSFLDKTMYHGNARSRVWSLRPTQSQSTGR